MKQPLLDPSERAVSTEGSLQLGAAERCVSHSSSLQVGSPLDESFLDAVRPSGMSIRSTSASSITPEILAAVAHPANDAFHNSEYGPEAACEKCNQPAASAVSAFAPLAFVAIGCSLRFAWNCVYLSEAYLETIIGKNVLGRLGLTQDGATLVGMLLFLGGRLLLPYRQTLTVAVAYMALLCLLLPILVYITGSVPALVLYALIAGNGLAAGVAQAAAGALGGLFAGSVSSYVLIGGSMASLAPTTVQLATMALASPSAPARRVLEVHKEQLYIVFAIGCVGLGLGVAAVLAVTGWPYFKQLAAKERQRLKTLHKGVAKAKTRGRLRVIKLHVVSVLWTWLLTVYLSSLTPFVPEVSTHPTPFWSANLATVLIAVGNYALFLGNLSCRLLARFDCLQSNAFLLTFSVLRTVLGVVVVMYIRRPFFVVASPHELVASMFLFAVFFVANFSAGVVTNLTSSKCQSMCSFNAAHTCPIVGTLIWIGIQVGVLLGAAVSLLPLT